MQQTCMIVATNTKDYPVAIKTGTTTVGLTVTPDMRRIEPQASVTICGACSCLTSVCLECPDNFTVSVSRSLDKLLEMSDTEHVWIQISAMPPGCENSAERLVGSLCSAPLCTVHYSMKASRNSAGNNNLHQAATHILPGGWCGGSIIKLTATDCAQSGDRHRVLSG
jgi:hypothetical protein